MEYSNAHDAAISRRMPTPIELGRSEALWQSVVENSPDFIVLVDFEGRIEFLNRAHDVLQNHAALGTSIYDYIPPASHQMVRQALELVCQTGRSAGYDVVAEGLNGTLSCYSSRVGPVWQQGRMTGLMIVSTDITERKQAEQELSRARAELEERVAERTAELLSANATLSASEERFRQLAENIEAVFWLCNRDLTELYYVSPSFEQIWAMSRADVYRNPRSCLWRVHHEDRHRLNRTLEAGLRQDVVEGEFRLVLDDGTIRWLRTRAFPFFNQQHEVVRVAGLAEDITERKRAREELVTEQRFLRRLLTAHERDQQLTAYDIHDGILQDVIGAAMQLETITSTDEPLNARQRERLELSGRLLRKAISEGRRLIGGLRPPAIDEQGIVAGIEHLLEDHRAQHGLTIEFRHAAQFGRLEPFVEGTIFRLAQEALNNCARHSQARRVEVDLSEHAGTITLLVRDDGVGFDVQSDAGRGWGLEGMHKRAQLLGGRAIISSHPGQGTEVRVELPLSTGSEAPA